MQCLILAGGLGTRMLPATALLSKALLPVNGLPFAHFQLELLASRGVRDVVYSIGNLGEQIVRYVGDGGKWGLRVTYADEGDRRLGTAGGIRLALDLGLLSDGFLLVYGDSFVPVDFRALWEASGRGAQCVMAVIRNDDLWDRSNVRFEGGQLLYNKNEPDAPGIGMRHIDYGLLSLTSRFIRERVPPGEPSDLAERLHELSVAGELRGHEVYDRFYEIGSPAGLRALELHLAAQAAGRAQVAE